MPTTCCGSLSRSKPFPGDPAAADAAASSSPNELVPRDLVEHLAERWSLLRTWITPDSPSPVQVVTAADEADREGAQVVDVVQRMGLRAEYDPQADALYVYFSDKPYNHGIDLDDARRLDYAADGTVVGVELLSPRAGGVHLKGLPRARALAALLRELGFTVTGGTPSSPRR